MSDLSKNIRFLLISFIMLIMIIMQSACDKEGHEERDAFIDSIKGEWQMSRIERNSPSQVLIIQGAIDSLFYILNWDTTVVYINDPTLCALPEIEKFQDWTITEEKKDLHLVTRDLCGTIRNCEIKYENITVSYDWDWMGLYLDEEIKADVRFLGEKGSISLKDFNISNGYSISYNVTENYYNYTYQVVR
jgi:hypothetical protein